jgi:hypothetical protein
MRKLTIAAIALLISLPALSQDRGAEVSEWNVEFFSFTNFCTGENVRPFPGETIRLVLRESASPGSFHGIALASGHVNGYGVLSGDAYSLTLSMSGFLNSPSLINVENGNGVVKFRAHTFITSMTDPSVGVSSRDTNIQVVIKNGVPEVVHLDTNVTGDCTAL